MYASQCFHARLEKRPYMPHAYARGVLMLDKMRQNEYFTGNFMSLYMILC